MSDTTNPNHAAGGEGFEFPDIDENMLDELVVVMLQGSNIFGDKVYSYVQLTVAKLREMAGRVARNENFKPSDFGQVIAAGRGDPPEDVREEMAKEHNLVDVPNADAAYDATNPDMKLPSFMDDDSES